MSATSPGAADVVAEQVTGGRISTSHVDREAAARYGVTVGDIQDVIETAVGENEPDAPPSKGASAFPSASATRAIRGTPSGAGQRARAGARGAQMPLAQVARSDR